MSHEQAFKRMGERVPELVESFFAFAGQVKKDGALSAKAKALMQVAIAAALRCDRCLDVHIRAARELGATEDELYEALGVAMLMGGGPAAAAGAVKLDQHLSGG